MEPYFEIGTVVYLRSGSPMMTVVGPSEKRFDELSYYEYKVYPCEWENDEGEKVREYFRPHALTETRPELKS
jgi:uncharacterized protein YodC (DUF2158 family)